MKKVEIYSDGACQNNQQDENVGGWGALLIYKGTEKEISGGTYNTTNNIMELTAMIEGLKQLKETKLHVEIYSDSAYIVNAFHERWIDRWRLNGWKTSQKKPVENKELWEELIGLVEKFTKVDFYKVKGHLSPTAPSVGKWHEKFNQQRPVSRQEFEEILQYNQRVDGLANRGIAELEQSCSQTI